MGGKARYRLTLRTGQSAQREAEEQVMDKENTDADEAVLKMAQRYEVVMIDDVLISQPDFSWAQLFLAIDRLSRKNLIAIRRVGLRYRICSMNQALMHGQAQHHEEPAASHR